MAELDDLLARWRTWQQAQDLSERTIGERAAVITRYCAATGDHPLHLDPEHLAEWLARPGLKVGTRSTYGRSLHDYSMWLQRVHLRPDNPMLDVPRARKPTAKPRPVTDPQLERIIAAARKHHRMMVLLGAYAGLRVHEIAKVHRDDVDWDAGTLHVVGKGQSEWDLPLHGRIIAESEPFRDPEHGWWFPGDDDGHISRQGAAKAIKDAMVRAGVRATPHQLRHAFGTNLLAKGADLREVQELMRHTSIASTQIYTEVSNARRAAAIARL